MHSEYVNAPEGTHLARCYQIIDLGPQEQTYSGESSIKEKVVLGWELPGELMDDGRPFSCTKMYTNSLNEKSNLRRDLESWRTQKFTAEELDGFYLPAVLGAPCQVTIVWSTGERTYSNVVGVVGVPKGVVMPPPVNPPISYDRDQHDQAVFDSLPHWMRDKIIGSKSDAYTTDGAPGNQPLDFDDEIPF